MNEHPILDTADRLAGHGGGMNCAAAGLLMRMAFKAGQPEWISVGEKVPANSESVLLYLDHRDGHGGAQVGYYMCGEFWLYEGDNVRCVEADVDATHWMPLPEPPATVPEQT